VPKEIAGAVESLEVFRVPSVYLDGWSFHIHWTATNGGKGCTVKRIPNEQIRMSQYATMARIGLSEQALTGNPTDSFDAKVVINLQRTAGAKSGLFIPGQPEIEALLSLPGGRNTIPIPVYDREPDDTNRSAKPLMIDVPKEEGFILPEQKGGRRL
jgi:hypothetical protein